MIKITSYRAGFNTQTRLGRIEFIAEGKKPVVFDNMQPEHFNATVAILSTGNAYGTPPWIHTGPMSSVKSAADEFEVPEDWQIE